MLSKTDDKNPSPNVESHEASGSFSTGIIEAVRTKESKNILPLNAPGITDQSGARRGTITNNATQTDAPINGK